jgi:hypothetical protein
MCEPFISGSWIDVVHACPRDGVYWNRKTLAYTEAEWRTLVRHLRHDLGIELLMIQCVVKDGLAVYPSAFLRQEPVETRWYTRNCHDPLGAIIRACSEVGLDFYPGVGYIGDVGDTDLFGTGTDALAWYRGVSEELLALYGDEPSFRGWYMAAEMAIVGGAFQPQQVELAAALTGMWAELTPGWPTLASPYFRGGDARLGDTPDNARLLQRTGLSAIAYQDGIGVATAIQVPAAPDPIRNARVFAEARTLHDRTGVALWANVESFCFENEIFFQPLIPAPFERLRAQIDHAAPHVDRIVSYTMPGLMTSQKVCPDLGVADTDKLHQAYAAYRAGR